MELSARPENDRLLDYLQAHAHRSDRRSAFDMDEYELHCHPDLIEHLVALGGDYRPCYGLPVLVHENGVAFAFAEGTSTLVLRLPPAAQADVLDAESSSDHDRATIRETTLRLAEALGPDWVAADPWPNEIAREPVLELLRGWVRRARDHELVTPLR